MSYKRLTNTFSRHFPDTFQSPDFTVADNRLTHTLSKSPDLTVTGNRLTHTLPSVRPPDVALQTPAVAGLQAPLEGVQVAAAVRDDVALQKGGLRRADVSGASHGLDVTGPVRLAADGDVSEGPHVFRVRRPFGRVARQLEGAVRVVRQNGVFCGRLSRGT